MMKRESERRRPVHQTLWIEITLRKYWAMAWVCAAMQFATAIAWGAEWEAGFSRVVITPQESMWMAGYAGRPGPSEGKIHDLYARGVALKDASGHRIVMVSTDLIGIPSEMAAYISDELMKKHGIPREDLMLTCSHTHCGPALADRLKHIYFLSEEENQKVVKYQEILNRNLLLAIDQALSDLRPARLSIANGRAEFASYRRQPMAKGPFDHDVPVLKVTEVENENLRGIVFGYACHNTTMGFQKFCGDYAGFAALNLERSHPGATALFFAGCGADQNPLPRRKLPIAEKYGRMLSGSVEEVLEESTPLPATATLKTSFTFTPLPLAHTPSRAEVENWSKDPEKYRKSLGTILLQRLDSGEEIGADYSYPIQVWRFGDQLTWVALGGEVTVEYSLRLKKELAPGAIWVTGYANDVMSYIPSERVLREGGYEGESSMVYYMMPSKWAEGIEERIVGRVREMFAATAP